MPIFQKSIVDKYLDTLETDVIEKAYDSYKEVYSAEKIKRIKTLNEEKYQAGFLKDIFGSVLGYTIDPEVGYNIELEKKNETNSKKADGAIVQDEKVLGVIELKSNTTKNLESIKDQAFGYKNNHKGCKYVISSNFHKLRFYVDDATEYEEFDLYNLDKETFKKFYLYLRKEGLLDKNIPKLLKEETKFHEENISKQLYKDYSTFKNKFFENIVKNNPQHDKLLLFKKSQKFLDRILFVLFAEDKELIPTNAISRIVESWALADDLHYKPLYELFTILFEHLNVGHIYKSGYEIPAYNGGLFAPDEVLDNLKVDDEILKDDLLTLSKYDFNTDVDVNILGHIFEHSLSEIEEIEAELKGEVADKSKGKRKKDGVFYTPKYITKYIVDNTVGKLCSEKKTELDLDVDFDVQDYQKSNGSVNARGKELFHTLESYKEWLLSLKILDPACGSGAFLNQALSFLIEEHKNIDDLIAELTNTPLRIFDTDKAILENNIFGVDINDESIEIAKLSLWLRTAQRGRKLSNLNDNIKCGNSLIDDPEIAGDKAFKWEQEFPEIFKNGGFDVVIGNPPYGAKLPKKDLNFIVEKYSSGGLTKSLSDTYVAFYIISSELLLKKNGILSFIAPNTWRLISSGKGFRDFMFGENSCVFKIVQHLEKVFADATVDCDTVFIKKSDMEPKEVNLIIQDREVEVMNHQIDRSVFKKQDFYNLNLTDKHYDLRNKIKSKGELVSELFVIKNGIKPYEKGKGKPPQTSETMKEKPFTSDIKISDKSLPLIGGSLFNRYQLFWNENSWIEYGEWLAAPRDASIFEAREKLIFRQTSDTIIGVKIGNGYIMRNNTHILLTKDNRINLNYALGILNSKLTDFFYWTLNPEKGEAMAEVKAFHLGMLVLPVSSDSIQNVISEKVDVLLKKNGDKTRLLNKFTNYLQSQFLIDNLTKKLKNWHELEFGDFIKELNKAIKKTGVEKLTKMDEMDWMEVFETKKEEVQKLKTEIDKTDAEIDAMVYELYELSEEEIQIVENN